MPVRNASAPVMACDGPGSGTGPMLRLGPGAGTRIVPPLLPGMFGTASVGPPTLGGASAGAVTADARGTTSPTAGARLLVCPLEPSKPKAENRPRPTVNTAAGMRWSDIRIGPDLLGATRMGHGTAARVADLLGVLPQIARGEIRLPRLPGGAPLVELGLGELDVERAL